MRLLFAFIGRFFDRAFCLALAITATQAPVYVAQYIDVLSGARTEARKLYDDLEKEATKFSMDVEGYISRIEANSDTLVRSHAGVSRRALERYKRYEAAWAAFEAAPGWKKPLVWLRYREADLEKAVQFEPGLNFTMAGLLYAGIGLVVGMLFTGLVGSLFSKKEKKVAAHGPKK